MKSCPSAPLGRTRSWVKNLLRRDGEIGDSECVIGRHYVSISCAPTIRESIWASKTQQSQPVREVFPYINFCVVPPFSSKKRGYWQSQRGYSTPVLLGKEIPCAGFKYLRVEL